MRLFNRSKLPTGTPPRRHKGRPDAHFYYYAMRLDKNVRGGLKSKIGHRTSGPNWRAGGTLIVAMVIIASVAGYLLTLETKPRIAVFGDEEGRAVLIKDTETYQQAAREILGSSILNRSKITINTASTAQIMKARFPELKNVAITIPIVGRQLVFELEPATPSLLLVAGAAGLYVIDERGRAVAVAEEVKDIDRFGLVLVSDKSATSIRLGEPILPSETVKFIKNLNDHLSAANVTVESAALPAIPNELHLRLLGSTYFVKFDTSGDPRLQSGALLAVREELKSKNIVPSEYIDVRARHRVFYQ